MLHHCGPTADAADVGDHKDGPECARKSSTVLVNYVTARKSEAYLHVKVVKMKM